MEDTQRVDTVYHGAFTVSAYLTEPGSAEPEPGETIGIELVTRFQGVPVDPVELKDGQTSYPYTGASRSLEIGGPGHIVGRFYSSIEAPVQRQFHFMYNVEAIYVRDGVRLEAGDDMNFWMEHFFELWAHVLETGANRTVIELYVMEEDGVPVPGAEVRLDDWELRSHGCDAPDVRTDLRGRAELDMPFGWPGDQSVRLEGTVVARERTQAFSVHLTFPDHRPLINSGTAKGALGLVTPEPLSDNRSVTLELAGIFWSDDLDDKEYTFYVRDRFDVYFNGVRSGDSDSVFRLDLTLPDLDIRVPEGHTLEILYSSVEMGDMSRTICVQVVDSWNLPDETAPPIGGGLLVDRTRPDGTIDVTVVDPSVDGVDEHVRLIVGMGVNKTNTRDLLRVANNDLHLGSVQEGGWSRLPPLDYRDLEWRVGMSEHLEVPCGWDGGKYTARVIIPSNASGLEDLFFIGFVEDKATGEVHLALESIPSVDDDGGSASFPTGDGSPLLTFIVYISIAAVVVVLAAWLVARRRRRQVKGKRPGLS